MRDSTFVVLVTAGVLAVAILGLPMPQAQTPNPNQRLLDLVRDHVTIEVDRAIAAVGSIDIPRPEPPPTPVELRRVRLRVGPGGGPGGQRRSLIADVIPPHAMVECAWLATGGVHFSPGNRSAYIETTPSRGDSVEVECSGIYPWATGSEADRVSW